MKNLIFAAIGPKPEIVLDNAVNNDLRIVRNEEYCLVYDRPLAGHGLLWSELADWWADREHLAGQPKRAVWLSLHQRLRAINRRQQRRRAAHLRRLRETLRSARR